MTARVMAQLLSNCWQQLADRVASKGRGKNSPSFMVLLPVWLNERGVAFTDKKTLPHSHGHQGSKKKWKREFALYSDRVTGEMFLGLGFT